MTIARALAGWGRAFDRRIGIGAGRIAAGADCFATRQAGVFRNAAFGCLGLGISSLRRDPASPAAAPHVRLASQPGQQWHLRAGACAATSQGGAPPW